MVSGDFEWDSEKAATNVVKHGVSFAEAITALVDVNAVEIADAEDAERILTIGFSSHARLLLVVSTDRATRTRIISARLATPAERAIY